ncbi:MAG: hypothetical protein D4S01_03185 [Dehalococcoidia bacterium]|nr:MAG: hypothetical protein D4S01_03185 [Dehalococcoidia bacterium]
MKSAVYRLGEKAASIELGNKVASMSGWNAMLATVGDRRSSKDDVMRAYRRDMGTSGEFPVPVSGTFDEQYDRYIKASGKSDVKINDRRKPVSRRADADTLGLGRADSSNPIVKSNAFHLGEKAAFDVRNLLGMGNDNENLLDINTLGMSPQEWSAWRSSTFDDVRNERLAREARNERLAREARDIDRRVTGVAEPIERRIFAEMDQGTTAPGAPQQAIAQAPDRSAGTTDRSAGTAVERGTASHQ